MLKGFKNFLMRGDVVVVAVGLVVALAFSTLIQAFAHSIIDPLVARAEGSHGLGLGVQLGGKGNTTTFLNFGTLVSAIVYFLIFMAVVYAVLVVPYKSMMARSGKVVFGDPAPTKTCPFCLSDDLPVAASKCRHCASQLPPGEGADSAQAAPHG
jgi:large conductance mechanosensitive channel